MIEIATPADDCGFVSKPIIDAACRAKIDYHVIGLGKMLRIGANCEEFARPEVQAQPKIIDDPQVLISINSGITRETCIQRIIGTVADYRIC